MSAYIYPISLAAISLFTVLLERFFPWRKDQKQWRPKLWSDGIHLVFNGHFLGILLAGLAGRYLLPPLDRFLSEHGLIDAVYRNAAAEWPLWAQIVVALVVVDFLQWCVHNLLHRVPFLWELHKAHHSVVDGEMDWIVAFRFSWLEVVVYRSLLYLPLIFFGFSGIALMVHAVFGTLIGHLNHSNLDLSYGPLRYVLNSPRMHIWHHDYEGDSKTTVNYGIIFSAWDWIFGTAKMPDAPPARIGFRGVETFPKNFFAHQVWPLQRVVPRVRSEVAWSVVGAAVLAAAWIMQDPPHLRAAPRTPMLGEEAAASQPSHAVPPAGSYASTPEEATRAIEGFGTEARELGYAHPESMVSVSELARALLSPSVALLDVRPSERFVEGHLPGARRLYRSDYGSSEEIPGLSRSAEELRALLSRLGVADDDTIVLYGDGGPEPYRLWWTLRTVLGVSTRVLDGGLMQWKAEGHRIAGGEGRAIAPARRARLEAAPPVALRWESLRAFREVTPAPLLVDTRSEAEFEGRRKHRRASRSGRIPQATHLDWVRVMRDPATDHRLSAPAALRTLFEGVGIPIEGERRILTYCQSGTRSSAVFFALHQVGVRDARLRNYDGSWAEYSRLELAVAP